MTPIKTYRVFEKLEAIIPLLFLVSSGIIFIPAFGLGLSFKSGLYIHFISFLILGVFFEIPELSLNIWCLLKVRHKEGLAKSGSLFNKIFRVRYILTHFLAPSAGILTIASGLYLILLGKDSLTQGWLFWLLCTSTIGLYKGIIQHRFYIKKILLFLQDPRKIADLPYYVQSPFDNICIFSECPTYIFNYWLASRKPSWLPNPFFDLVHYSEQWLHSRALVGLLMVGLGSLLIFPLRSLIRKYSRVY